MENQIIYIVIEEFRYVADIFGKYEVELNVTTYTDKVNAQDDFIKRREKLKAKYQNSPKYEYEYNEVIDMSDFWYAELDYEGGDNILLKIIKKELKK